MLVFSKFECVALFVLHKIMFVLPTSVKTNLKCKFLCNFFFHPRRFLQVPPKVFVWWENCLFLDIHPLLGHHILQWVIHSIYYKIDISVTWKALHAHVQGGLQKCKIDNYKTFNIFANAKCHFSTMCKQSLNSLNLYENQPLRSNKLVDQYII